MMNVSTHSSETITLSPSIRAPPTPPPTEEKETPDTGYILREVAQHLSAASGQTKIIHKVEHKVLTAVLPSLAESDKLRFNYFPLTKRLVLRMPEKVHEWFLCSLSGRITEQLRLLSQGSGSIAEFAEGIGGVGSATIRPRDPEYGTHCPDFSFQHLKSPSPTVIIEIAHSQKWKKLRTLAEEYILGSDLEIRVVVGVDIEYTKTKRATFSVWRAGMQGPENDRAWVVEPVVGNQIFRQDDGKPNIDQGVGLRLHLEDFADPKTCQQFENIDGDIFISCGELYQFLEKAETVAKVDDIIEPEHNPRLKKRRRTQTPEEQLDDRDEESYVRDLERVSKRQDFDDASYVGSSSVHSSEHT